MIERKYKKSDWQVRNCGRETIHLALDGCKSSNNTHTAMYDIITQVERRWCCPEEESGICFQPHNHKLPAAVLIRATVHGFSFPAPDDVELFVVFLFSFRIVFHSWKMSLME